MTTLPDGRTDDGKLIGRLQRRDPRALAELYDRYGAGLYARMSRAAGSRSAAEDLVHETFVRAWNRVRSFDAERLPAGPWLSEIAREIAPQWDDSDIPPTGATPPPSPKVRRRILASAGYERFGWAPFLGAAAVLALSAAIYFGGREHTFALEVLHLREQMGQQEIALTSFREALAILTDKATVQTPFSTNTAHGMVFANTGRGILLTAANLAPAPPGKTYEMWLISKSGKATPAGLFRSRPDGTAMHVARGPVQPDSASAVEVTLEPEGGSAQPGSAPLITAYLLFSRAQTSNATRP